MDTQYGIATLKGQMKKDSLISYILVATGERKKRGLYVSENPVLNQLWKGGLSCGE